MCKHPTHLRIADKKEEKPERRNPKGHELPRKEKGEKAETPKGRGLQKEKEKEGKQRTGLLQKMTSNIDKMASTKTKIRIKRNNQNQRNNHQDRRNSNFDKDLKNRYKEPEFEFDSIIESEGVLDIMQDGYGFLRSSDYNYLSSPDDIYVSQSQIRLFGLKNRGYGTWKYYVLQKKGKNTSHWSKVNKINGLDPQVVRDRVAFEHLTPLFPREKFNVAQRTEHTIHPYCGFVFPNRERTKGYDRSTAQNG